MSRIAFIFIAAVLLLSCCTSVEGGFVAFEVQLANGDDSFFSFGNVHGDVQENSQLFSKLTWDRPEYNPAQQEAFAALVKQNGFVRIRVPSDLQGASAPYVQAAARARCLAHTAAGEQVKLHFSASGYVSALEYRVECAEQPSHLPSGWSQPQQVAVISQFPETVEPLRQTATPGLDSSGLPEGSTIYPESQDPGYKLGLEGEGRKKVPVKDERHWLVKNWIFLIPAGMLLLNLLGAGDTTPPARTTQVATPSTAQAAPAASARASGSSRSRKQR